MASAHAESAPDYGRLLRDEDVDLVVCHLCRRSFRALGSHLRAHGLTADQYRDRYGLLRTRALTSRALSRTRSARQREVYQASERMRADFAQGQDMARSGELARHARLTFAEHGLSPELERENLERLAKGRHAQAAAAQEHLEAAARALGFDCLRSALQGLYVHRELSLDATADKLGISPKRTRDHLLDLGIRIRPTGQNTAAGRRARASLNDQATAKRVGTTDITTWLVSQRATGTTLRELASATGRSIPWITARLRRAALGPSPPLHDQT